jgi:hypothetical protein
MPPSVRKWDQWSSNPTALFKFPLTIESSHAVSAFVDKHHGLLRRVQRNIGLCSALCCERGFRLPVLKYFLVVGTGLIGLLFYANSVMAPAPLPFSVSQKIGLPEAYKTPVIEAEDPKPVIVATTIDPPVQVKKSVKAIRKHKPAQVVRQPVAQGHYAAYPPREPGSIW